MDADIRQKIIMIQLKIKELRSSGITEPFDLEIEFMKSYPDLYDRYPTIIKRFCREENQDNNYLYKMINLLEQVNENKLSLEKAEKDLGQELANKFLYPVVKEEERKKNK